MKKKNTLKNLIRISVALMAIVIFVGISFISIDGRDNEKIKEDQLGEAGPDQRPSEWAWERRTFPYYKADAEAFREEMRKAQSMKSQSSNRGLHQIDFAGPTNVGGRISDIEFNPEDTDIVYAGSATGGVFKSTDMGLSWSPIFDDQANLSIGDIGIDPNDGDVIYVGTGEANGGHNNFPGGGMYKSTDAGQSWDMIGLENTVSIGRIVVDPSNSDRVFVAGSGFLFYNKSRKRSLPQR